MHSYSPTPAERNACGATTGPFIPLLVVVLGFVSGISLAHAQVPRVSQEQLASHLMTYVGPSYPSRAQSAKVQGKVIINVEISPDGLVRSTKVLSGPPMLRYAAASSVKQWRYSPFQSGEGTIAVTGDVLVSFTLLPKPAVHTPHQSSANGSHSVSITFPPTDHRGEPDEEIAKRFDIPWETCTRGVIAYATDMGTADACKQAAAIADEFPPDRRFTERRRAYVYAATASGNVRDLQAALHYADKAVELVKLGHDDNRGCESAYSMRGEIRAFSGDMTGADKDLSMAEDFSRKGQLSDALKRDLQLHAELLKRMGRLEEAQAKIDEAAKL